MTINRVGYANARGRNNVEHWYTLISDELRHRGIDVYEFNLRFNQPKKKEIDTCDFLMFHFSHVGNYFKRMGKPYCVIPSSHDFLRDNGRTLKFAMANKNCRFVTYQADMHHTLFHQWHIEEPHVYFPMPARTDVFKRSMPYNSDGKILMGGRLIPKKGIDRVLKHLDDVWVFGEGEMRNQLEAANSTAHFTGHLDGEALRKLYEEASLYLFPAVQTPDGDRDGMSNTVKEALLMELPTIVSSIGANKELDNVIVYDDWEHIAEFIKTIPRKPNTAGRDEAMTKFSPKACVDYLLKAIEEHG